MSSLAVKHSCDSATRSLKLVQTSIDSLSADLKTLSDAGYHNIEPLHNRCCVSCTGRVLLWNNVEQRPRVVNFIFKVQQGS